MSPTPGAARTSQVSAVSAPARLHGEPSATAVVLTAALSVAALVLAVAAFATTPRALAPQPPQHAEIALYLDGVAVDGAGRLTAVPAGTAAAYVPGTRVVDPTATGRIAADRAWLAAGPIPGAGGPHEDLVAGALLDLRALTRPGGVVLAANSPRWRYVWPRDAGFAAAAYAVAGHPEDAREVLLHLQDLHRASGGFEARYLPDGTGAVPDDRAAQSDGAGWLLWAASVHLAELPAAQRTEAAAELEPLTDAATTFIRTQVATTTGLPLPSSDHWETGPRGVTLGTAAPLLAGLEAAPSIYLALGRPAEAAQAVADAARLRAAVEQRFGAHGYPRHLDRPGSDAATAMLLPPFQPRALAGAREAWAASVAPMLRPAGGLAPGATWRQDGVSWTPQTALYALAAASAGDVDLAHAWLTWLAEHRTASGALPEKVLADGSPAAVAPLAWTSALVVLAVDAVDEAERRPLGPLAVQPR